ncbi:oligosaccharide flippase family protein [Flavobacterium cerinum]|uniref:Oligosaccharide flippase family protein n=1 Tax=Flavobacterium cerinum TaxID=2502784 RepID=A0ABY5IS55_9FLAO|nr:oligosaccharide flippase family protein [Flavobacterium cerinum]UUC45479.1 oligosaccharide flippase family protein [Flavobacterium cerinum]
MSGNSQTAYRHILKATSIFGGVQVFNILVSIIRSKIIAVLIGPAGMGIAGLLNATLNLIGGFSNLGLETSAVKDISIAKTQGPEKVARIIKVFSTLLFWAGILGAGITILLSPWLSQLSFGNYEYIFSFILVAIALFFRQLSVRNTTILQGLQNHKYFAKSSLYGNAIGLLLIVPLYYFWKTEAIAPVIIATYLIMYLVTAFFVKKLQIKKVSLASGEIVQEGKSMLQLGFMLSLNSIYILIAGYILQIFISNTGSVSEVGLFNAGFVIINTYVGLIFNAMGTDYYPKLAAISSDLQKINVFVNQQIYVAVLLITPVIIAFIIVMPYMIIALYSAKFLPIIAMVKWGIVGMLFKAVSWSLGYIMIVKDDSRMFIKTALFFNSLSILLNLLGYYYYGLEGLGISSLLYYIIHLVVIIAITRKRYNVYFENAFNKVFLLSSIMCILVFLLSDLDNLLLRYGLQVFLFLLASLYSVYQLDKKMDIRGVVNRFLKQKKDGHL